MNRAKSILLHVWKFAQTLVTMATKDCIIVILYHLVTYHVDTNTSRLRAYPVEDRWLFHTDIQEGWPLSTVFREVHHFVCI